MIAPHLPAARTAAGSLSPGLRYMAYSAFWFSIMSLLVKLAGRRLPSMEIVFVRAVVTLVLSWAMLRRAKLSPWGGRRGLLAVRGIIGFLSLTCFYFGIVHLPLAEATLIQYTNPVFAAILAAVLLHERIGARHAVGVAASLVGVVLVTRPAFLFGAHASAIDPRYAGIAFFGAIFSALVYVIVRMLRDTDHPLVVVFWFPLLTVPLALPFAALDWRWPTPLEWLVLLGVGASTQVAQVYMTRGLQLEPAGRATAVGYLQVAFAAAWGILFFGDRPTGWTLAGAAVIVASTVWIGADRKRPSPAPGLATDD